MSRRLSGGLRIAAVRRWVAGATSVVMLVSVFVLCFYDPGRIHRLLGAITNPIGFLDGGPAMGGPPPGAPPMAGPPPGASAMMSGVWILRWLWTGALCGVGLLAWRRRPGALPADTALIVGSTLAVILLTGPWVTADKAMRFWLIAAVPLVVVIQFTVLGSARQWVRGLLGGLGVMLILGPSTLQLVHGGRPIITNESYGELLSLAGKVDDPRHTLIVTRHGVEWWTAWALRTHVAQPQAVRTSDWDTYTNVMFLQLHSAFPFGPGRGAPGLPSAGRSVFFLQGPPPATMPDLKMDKQWMPPPMAQTPIPQDAAVVHEGKDFTLARVSTPPAFVKDRESGNDNRGQLPVVSRHRQR